MRAKYFKVKTTALLLQAAALTMASGVSGNIAFGEGFIERVGGPHEYNVDFSGSELQNTPGFSLTKDFSVPGSYNGTVYCSQVIPQSSVYYSGRTQMVPSIKNPGFLTLNDYLDIKVEIWIHGKLQQYMQVPFENISNQAANNGCKPPSGTITGFSSGSKGRVTFMVTKKIVNGVVIDNRELIQMFGRLGELTSGFSNIPMVRVNIASAMLLVPDKCIINEGQQIDVDFGENNGVDINNKNITKPIPVAFKCEGGAFETGKLNVNLAVSGDAASFDHNLIKTDKEALGVKFTHNGKVVTPNKFYPVMNIDNGGRWDLVAGLISRNNENIDEGEFRASATVVMSFL